MTAADEALPQPTIFVGCGVDFGHATATQVANRLYLGPRFPPAAEG